MKIKLITALAVLGIALAAISAYVYNRSSHALPAVAVNDNPYANGIYATGIVQGDQPQGDNVNLFPEVAGTVAGIAVREGQSVAAGQPLLSLDASAQAQQVAADAARADAAMALLRELRAEPRPEALAIAVAQERSARAALQTQGDQLAVLRKEAALDAGAVSRLDLRNAENAYAVAQANADVAARQLALTRAGAWSYDIANQQAQVAALRRTLAADRATLSKYTLRAPAAGTVLSVNAAVGDYVSPQGIYGSYSQGYGPVLTVAPVTHTMQVKCELDEILIPRLPPAARLHARLFVQGQHNVGVPLRLVRIEPYVVPKIELSNQRTEQVDTRVLPIVFAFDAPAGFKLYPGELVDVYIGDRP